jgi:hypothetical protein
MAVTSSGAAMGGRERKKLLAIGLFVVLSGGIVGCADLSLRAKQAEPEGYRVISYDAQTCTYVILSSGTLDGSLLKKRLTVRCPSDPSFSESDAQGRVRCSCVLQVGKLYTQNQTPKNRQDRLVIVEAAQWLTIEEGQSGVKQGFDIVKSEVIE